MSGHDLAPADCRLHDRLALQIGWHCQWCGSPLPIAPPGSAQAAHCNRLHARKHSAWRARSRDLPLRVCTRPDKRAYGSRGSALRFAVAYQQYPYLCGCGAFHLTCRPTAGFAAALAHLAAVLARQELAS